MPTIAVMMGIPASGKSTFCRTQLPEYERINLDELHTRRKEGIALAEAIERGRDIVIDNTNPAVSDREKYLRIAKENRYTVTGYFMQSRVQDCIGRNSERQGKARISNKAIAAISNKLEMPSYEEGFDNLFYVSMTDDGFRVEKWESETERTDSEGGGKDAV